MSGAKGPDGQDYIRHVRGLEINIENSLGHRVGTY